MKQSFISQNTGELLRFVSVAVAGLFVDISVAWLLSAVFNVNLVLSAGGGFAAGASVNYLLHEFWTFSRPESGVSVPRLMRYFVVLAATLAARLCAVYLLAQIIDVQQNELKILLLATVFSFFVNYLLSKLFVFQPAVKPKSTGKGNRP
jgi:putative flippase GtrA